MELVLLVFGLTSAVVAGVALAVHAHKLHDGAEKVGGYAIAATFVLSVMEALKEWNNWSDWNLHFHSHISPSGYVYTDPRPPPPNGWDQVKHIVGQWLLEAGRDLAITFVVFGILFFILRAAKDRAAGTS